MDRIAYRVRAFRKLQKMTQNKLAKKAGISVTTLNRIESGEDCKISALIKLEKALDKQLF